MNHLHILARTLILYSSKLREICHKGKTPGYRLLYVDKQPFVRSQNQRRSFLTNLDFMIWPSRVRVLSAILEFGVLPLLNSGDIAKFQKWTSILFLKLYSAKNRYISILCDVYIYIYISERAESMPILTCVHLEVHYNLFKNIGFSAF